MQIRGVRPLLYKWQPLPPLCRAISCGSLFQRWFKAGLQVFRRQYCCLLISCFFLIYICCTTKHHGQSNANRPEWLPCHIVGGWAGGGKIHINRLFFCHSFYELSLSMNKNYTTIFGSARSVYILSVDPPY